MEYKTVRELAMEFNISKATIYKKINYSMKDELKDHVVKQNKITYITPKGESLILNSLKKESKENTDLKNKEVEVSNKVSNELNFLTMLESELVNLKKENKNLIEINKELRYELYLNKRENIRLKQHQSDKYSYFNFIKNIFKDKAL